MGFVVPLSHVHLPCPFRYWFLVVILPLVIRLVLSVLRACQASQTPVGPATTFWHALWWYLRGLDPKRVADIGYIKGHDHGEYGASYVLGVIEVAGFSVLMAMGEYKFVGSWVALKTVAVYFRWQSDRVVFNVFLIGNALTVLSGWLLSGLVRVGAP
jgi:hypothetical protein